MRVLFVNVSVPARLERVCDVAGNVYVAVAPGRAKVIAPAPVVVRAAEVVSMPPRDKLGVDKMTAPVVGEATTAPPPVMLETDVPEPEQLPQTAAPPAPIMHSPFTIGWGIPEPPPPTD